MYQRTGLSWGNAFVRVAVVWIADDLFKRANIRSTGEGNELNVHGNVFHGAAGLPIRALLPASE
eukprot:4231216-Amphidinium_carterae.1